MRISKLTATDLTYKIPTTENIRALGLKVLLRSSRLHNACIIKSTRNIVCSRRSHIPYVTKCSDISMQFYHHFEFCVTNFPSLNFWHQIQISFLIISNNITLWRLQNFVPLCSVDERVLTFIYPSSSRNIINLYY
jgi:hypothetical protein